MEALVANRRPFRVTANWQFALKALTVAIFALLCAGCKTASADCRDEVAAAFERLTTSGRSYRMETTSVIGGQRTSRERSEFGPPDRMRVATNNGVSGHGPTETIQIRVGQRAWLNEGGWPWGWREWELTLEDALLRRKVEKMLADGVDRRAWIFGGGKDFAIVQFLLLRNYYIPADAMFECLGKVEFEGTTYIGYRNRLVRAIVEVAPSGSMETRREELSRKPDEWRTVLVDRESIMPAYDLVSQEYQLDHPSHKVQYTYPADLKIEPPFWCRLGLCPVYR